MKFLILTFVLISSFSCLAAPACDRIETLQYKTEVLAFMRSCTERDLDFFQTKYAVKGFEMKTICPINRVDTEIGEKYESFDYCIQRQEDHLKLRWDMYVMARSDSLRRLLLEAKTSNYKEIRKFVLEECPINREDVRGNVKEVLNEALKVCRPFTDKKFSHCKKNPLQFCQRILNYLKSNKKIVEL